MRSDLLIESLNNGTHDEVLKTLYEDIKTLDDAKTRFINAINKYVELFGDGELEVYSAPGRTEICGNHTDHQNGAVIAAAVSLDAIAITAPSDEAVIRLVSEEFGEAVVDFSDLEINPDEFGTTKSLIKGVIAGLKGMGYKIGGFTAYVTSDILTGAGLSSSAAFETLIATIISGMYNNMTISPVVIAKVGQRAENEYFGKPCGLMDQMASSLGGVIHIDFHNPNAPFVENLDYGFKRHGYRICLVNTGGSHADLTDCYAAIPAEMEKVAHVFDKKRLGEVTYEDFYRNLAFVRDKLDERSILRAIHFFEESRRVMDLSELMSKGGDIKEALKIIKESGNSSIKYLQNIYPDYDSTHQPQSLALALTEQFIASDGVCRVHGGGFAGTIQVFVKNKYVDEYHYYIEKFFGSGSCHLLRIRKVGGIKLM